MSYVNATVSDAASAGIVIAVGGSELHATFAVTSGGSARVRLYENPSTMTASTLVNIWNMNRESSACTTASGGHSPTFTGGCAIFRTHIPGGGKQTGGGGVVRHDTEWILNENTKYIIAASNLQGATTGISFSVEFYEH